MDLQFDGKTALVTGGGRGIGKALARGLHDLGAKVIVLDKEPSLLRSLQEECEEIQTVCVDLCDWSATKKAVQDLGRIDLLVNNAGLVHKLTFMDTNEDTFNETFAVNVRPIFNVSQVVAKRLMNEGLPGAIVNIASIGARAFFNETAAYSASKAAVVSVTKTMACELGPSKIRTNCVSLAGVLTELSRPFLEDPKVSKPVLDRMPLGKFAEVQEVVDSVVFLLSDKASMINGTDLVVDGGYTC